MSKSRPQPPRPDRRRPIRDSFSWIDHRFLREGFDQGLTRLEKLLYFVLVAISNQDGVLHTFQTVRFLSFSLGRVFIV
jgi:hypothetical protein